MTCLIKEAISSTIKIQDELLVIGLLEFLQTDKKIKTLTDTSELTEDAVFAATVEQNSGTEHQFIPTKFNISTVSTDIRAVITVEKLMFF